MGIRAAPVAGLCTSVSMGCTSLRMGMAALMGYCQLACSDRTWYKLRTQLSCSHFDLSPTYTFTLSVCTIYE